MNFGRIFAHALARRVAYVVVGFVLAALASLFVVGDAHAKSIEEAYAEAVSLALGVSTPAQEYCRPSGCTWNVEHQPFAARFQWFVYRTTGGVYFNGYVGYEIPCPVDKPWNEELKICGNGCDQRSPLGGGMMSCPGASDLGDCSSSVCSAGCTYRDPGTSASLYGWTVDGLIWIDVVGWEPTGSSCTPGPDNPEPGTPPTDSDGDGTSDGNDSSPNNPGVGGGGNQNDGEGGNGEDNSDACGGPGQPECNADGSGKGSGQGNTSGGGGDCNTPPRSSGDAILAQIAFQTWATRCAVVGNANQGSGTGTGTGSGGTGGGGGGGGGTGDKQPKWTEGEAPDAPTDDTDYVEEQRRFGLGLSTDMLDQQNLFGSGACTQVSFQLWGRTISTSMIPEWCQVMVWMRAIVLLMGAWSALNILLGRGLL